MTRYRNVSIKGRVFSIREGDVLLDGALAKGVDVPHDCRAGTCGTCMVQVVKGQTVCGETHTQGMVHACQARVVSDLEVEMEDVPEIDTTRARLTGLRELAPDIVELAIAPEKGITFLPGQYFRFAFNGFPARAYSATASLDGRIGGRVIHLNVKRVRGGRVSSCLGTTIRPGHRLRIEGPFGRAFLRPGGKGRLILAGSGTGFAPIWAIACMALREDRHRPIVVIAGARRLSALYMKPALAQLARLPNVTIIPAIEEGPSPHPSVRIGRVEAHTHPSTPPTSYMPADRRAWLTLCPAWWTAPPVRPSTPIRSSLPLQKSLRALGNAQDVSAGAEEPATTWRGSPSPMAARTVSRRTRI